MIILCSGYFGWSAVEGLVAHLDAESSCSSQKMKSKIQHIKISRCFRFFETQEKF